MSTNNTHRSTFGVFGIAAAAMLVSAASGQTFLIDIGGDGNGNGNAVTPGNWNNTLNDFIRLVDTDGNNSAAQVVAGIGMGAFNGGFGNNGGSDPGGPMSPDPSLGNLAVSTATFDYGFTTSNGNWRFSEMDPTRTFTLRIFGSRISASTRESRYTITDANGAQFQTVITSNVEQDGTTSSRNETTVIEFTGLVPDGMDGNSIVLNVAVEQGGFAYVNAMELIAEVPVSVTFDTEPVSTAVDAGGTLVFNAVVGGDPGSTFQWELDGVPLVDDARISGATTDTLTISQAGAFDAGNYQLIASNSGFDFGSEMVVGAVRGTDLGLADFDNNGLLNFFDVLSFLETFDAASAP